MFFSRQGIVLEHQRRHWGPLDEETDGLVLRFECRDNGNLARAIEKIVE